MNLHIKRGNHPIAQDVRSLISKRYKTITKAVNRDFWDSISDTAHSIYVGSYGRGTAIDTSDLDILVELPDSEYDHFESLKGNGQSRLLQVVKNAVTATYPRTDVKADGQVVVVNFSDDMKFEILPAFQRKNKNPFRESPVVGDYKYPDTHMGGRWLSTDPKAEQDAMSTKNKKSNGLLFDTCRHIRFIRSEHFSSYHLSGILIDSFVYAAIRDCCWPCDSKYDVDFIREYEYALLKCYNTMLYRDAIPAPGSFTRVSMDDLEVLGKVLMKMV